MTSPDAEPLASETLARRAWSYGFIRKAATPPPSYGTREWLALSDRDPRKVAAVCVAAECWAQGGDDLAAQLGFEVERMREVWKAVEDAEYQARAAAHRASAPAVVKATFAARRAAQLEAAKPRAGDYTGRGSSA